LRVTHTETRLVSLKEEILVLGDKIRNRRQQIEKECNILNELEQNRAQLLASWQNAGTHISQKCTEVFNSKVLEIENIELRRKE
jgi:hypothetical protein